MSGPACEQAHWLLGFLQYYRTRIRIDLLLYGTHPAAFKHVTLEMVCTESSFLQRCMDFAVAGAGPSI